MFQTIIIVGRVARDPEMRYLPSGMAVTDFPVAVNREYTNNAGEKIRETTWFRISVWDKQAENCSKYVQKGKIVLVEGRLRGDAQTGNPRIWKDQNGEPRSSYEVTAATVRFLSPRQGEADAPLEDAQAPAGLEDDNIPF